MIDLIIIARAMRLGSVTYKFYQAYYAIYFRLNGIEAEVREEYLERRKKKLSQGKGFINRMIDFVSSKSVSRILVVTSVTASAVTGIILTSGAGTIALLAIVAAYSSAHFIGSIYRDAKRFAQVEKQRQIRDLNIEIKRFMPSMELLTTLGIKVQKPESVKDAKDSGLHRATNRVYAIKIGIIRALGMNPNTVNRKKSFVRSFIEGAMDMAGYALLAAASPNPFSIACLAMSFFSYCGTLWVTNHHEAVRLQKLNEQCEGKGLKQSQQDYVEAVTIDRAVVRLSNTLTATKIATLLIISDPSKKSEIEKFYNSIKTLPHAEFLTELTQEYEGLGIQTKLAEELNALIAEEGAKIKAPSTPETSFFRKVTKALKAGFSTREHHKISSPLANSGISQEFANINPIIKAKAQTTTKSVPLKQKKHSPEVPLTSKPLTKKIKSSPRSIPPKAASHIEKATRAAREQYHEL